MNVSIIGSGGREHALAFKISQSPSVKNLFIIPGNPGTELLGRNINLDIEDHDSIVEFCKENLIDLVVIGPEKPLTSGLADTLRNNNIYVFGPSAEGARIEGDKAFTKLLMKKYGIPTADFNIFDKTDYIKCLSYLDTIKYPVVIKASGLAAGKGVIICNSREEAKKAVEQMFVNGLFGSSGDIIVIEEYLEGIEASIFVITDGKEYLILPPSQDHKRVFDNDKGKNTGGMGAYAPTPFVSKEILSKIELQIIKPTLESLQKEDIKYSGCLYVGVMLTENDPKVVEFNCRFGDPETQAVLPIIDGDFLKLLFSTAAGSIDKNAIHFKGGCAICVILASGGYPDHYEKGYEIFGLDELSKEHDFVIFHSGTKKINNKIVTNGGRVLGITKINRLGNLTLCKQELYKHISKVKYDSMHYRLDIADKALS